MICIAVLYAWHHTLVQNESELQHVKFGLVALPVELQSLRRVVVLP